MSKVHLIMVFRLLPTRAYILLEVHGSAVTRLSMLGDREVCMCYTRTCTRIEY